MQLYGAPDVDVEQGTCRQELGLVGKLVSRIARLILEPRPSAQSMKKASYSVQNCSALACEGDT